MIGLRSIGQDRFMEYEGIFLPRTSREWSIPVSRGELAAVYEPYVHRRFARNDPEWRAIVKGHRRRWMVARLRCFLRSRPYAPVRPQAKVKDHYERGWERFELGKLAPNGQRRFHALHWNSDYHLGNASGIQRVHLWILERLIETLKPESVLEVGAGSGINLVALAAHCPNVKFTGLELTATGVARAESLSQSNALPAPLTEFVPFDMPHMDAMRRITFHNGSAQALPFEDRAFDLVYTRQALEQMESIRDLVLREIARVSAEHVVMYEAFRDWNSHGMRRNRTIATGYFAARLSDLERYGLEVIATTADLPSKIYMQVGLVVGTKTESRGRARKPAAA